MRRTAAARQPSAALHTVPNQDARRLIAGLCLLAACSASGGDQALLGRADPNQPASESEPSGGTPNGADDTIDDIIDDLDPGDPEPDASCPAGSSNGDERCAPPSDIAPALCGDGLVGGLESCDDGPLGVALSGDGCSNACELEPGFVCPLPGASCRAACGDGLVRGREACDPSSAAAGSSEACDDSCRLRAGWVCPADEACRLTECGDGIVEGTEQCDDSNRQPYDGCSSLCAPEPRCGGAESPIGACASSCGDGILLAGDAEACDDGNRSAGDGCDASCQLEPGYRCTTSVEEPPDFIEVSVVLRDFSIFQSFQGPGETNPIGHPDMNRLCCALVTGIVEPLLGADRKPVYAGAADAAPLNQTSGQVYFDQWYRDVPGVNLRFDQNLRLTRQGNGSYAFNSSLDAPWAAIGGFFPLDQLGYGSENLGHNFFFTSELRYWFEYKGGEQLDFSGDDDVWVFINGHLAVDLGGVHGRTFARVLLGNDGTGLGCSGDGCTPNLLVDYELEPGNIYEVVVFHAERHPGESNYFLTLANFLPGLSQCASVCGDGVLTPDEACDLGAGNTGQYGGCNSNCSLAPFCGDGVVDSPRGEQCDDRINASLYGGCAPGCVLGPRCGDGVVQSGFEECEPSPEDVSRRCLPDCTIDPLR